MRTRFSIFTPTHNVSHLDRLARSIERQTFRDFEWVVAPNNGATSQDVRVWAGESAKLAAYRSDTDSVGELKRFATMSATGDILVEVDHDDEITPDCLEHLSAAFDDPAVDFVYSNSCEIKDGQPFTYNERFGWKSRPFSWAGRDDHIETIAFPPSPMSFSKIWYAPNHVRAWRASFYHRIGGHDPARDVLDDQDLLCRTFVQGNVRHVDRCLYVQHHHGDNTSTGSKNGRIQTETLELHDRYVYPMAERWARESGLRLLDLCGAINGTDGYETVDLHGADVVADLNERWPFDDGTVGVIRAHDALEHLRDPQHVMREAFRVLGDNGWFLTQTPSTDGRGAFQDPTHVSFWNSNSFWYYTRQSQNRFIDCPVRFQANRVVDFFPTEFHRQHNIVYTRADLVKIAGRMPGGVTI